MNPEYLLDAMGLLDDDLIQEAEQYQRRKPRINYSRWLAWAASFAVVIVLGYGVTHIGMGGGGSAPNGGASTGGAAASGCESMQNAPSATDSPDDSDQAFVPEEPSNGAGGTQAGDWYLALMADGTVYWATEEYIDLDPEEDDIRYTTSFINSVEPEEEGQANFLPVGTAYVVLDNGIAAVYQEDTGSWRVYDSVPLWEK